MAGQPVHSSNAIYKAIEIRDPLIRDKQNIQMRDIIVSISANRH